MGAIKVVSHLDDRCAKVAHAFGSFPQRHEKRAALMQLADLFKAEIVDVGKNHATIQLVSWPKRYEAEAKRC